jgi:hypothetical protein
MGQLTIAGRLREKSCSRRGQAKAGRNPAAGPAHVDIEGGRRRASGCWVWRGVPALR